jgi:hypothetical protein
VARVKALSLISLALVSALLASGCHTTLPEVTFCEGTSTAIGHVCTQFLASEPIQCGGGSHQVAECPSTNELGSCTASMSVSGTDVEAFTVFYSDGGETVTEAQAECAAVAGSTWKAN